jgi:hypothetical protein
MCGELNVEAVVGVGVVLPESASWPIFYIPAQFVQWVSEMGASLDVDVTPIAD